MIFDRHFVFFPISKSIFDLILKINEAFHVNSIKILSKKMATHTVIILWLIAIINIQSCHITNQISALFPISINFFTVHFNRALAWHLMSMIKIYFTLQMNEWMYDDTRDKWDSFFSPSPFFFCWLLIFHNDTYKHICSFLTPSHGAINIALFKYS